jgi:hypothetical protein
MIASRLFHPATAAGADRLSNSVTTRESENVPLLNRAKISLRHITLHITGW